MPVPALPEGPSGAAQAFYRQCLADIYRAAKGADALCLVFDAADYTHRTWRLAAIQSLARELAPVRVNAIAGNDPRAIAAASAYLNKAEGVTGQILQLDSAGAGKVLHSGYEGSNTAS